MNATSSLLCRVVAHATVLFLLVPATALAGARLLDKPEVAPPALHVNDASSDGDKFSAAPGSDTTGDGSAQRPFATLARAVTASRPGSVILIDTGEYNVGNAIVLERERLRLRGAGADGTRLVSAATDGTSTLAITTHGVLIEDLSISGGGVGITLRGDGAILRRVRAHSQDTYGILLEESSGSVLQDCRVWGSGFRGVQISGGGGNFILNCWSSANGNAGYCLSGTRENLLSGNIANGNGTSGFFVTNDSADNEVVRNASYRNGLGGFYLFDGSTGNVLKRNESNWNQRGFVLKDVQSNRLVENAAASNHYAEFQVRGESHDNTLDGNIGKVESLAGQ